MAVTHTSPPRKRGTTILLAVALAAAIVLLVALTPAGNAAPARGASNSVTFQDSTGEDALAPDISTVVVSNDDKGLLTWVINTPNKPALTPDMLFLIFIDSDTNAATGDDGFDYVLQLIGPLEGSAEVGLFRWNGTEFVATGVSQATLVFSYANGPTIKLNAAELGGTKRFSFLVIAISGLALTPEGELDLTNIHRDFAPGVGVYSYDVRITPPALVIKSFGVRPLIPRAGRPFSAFVTFATTDGSPTTAATATCRATLGGKALPASGSTVSGSRATCTWAVPKLKSKGKTIRGTITVRSGALRASRNFTARVS